MKKRLIPWKEPKTGMFPIIVRMDKPTIKAVNQKAYDRKMNRSSFIRMAVDAELKRGVPRFEKIEL